MASPVPQRPTRDSHGCDPRAQARQWCHRQEERPNHEPPATGLEWVVTTYAVTCGGRQRLNWMTAGELEELRPVADTEQHHMRSDMDDQRFLNSYHNASTPPGPDVPADLAGFMLAADPILGEAAELSRVLAHAHQGSATQLIAEDWAHARKYFSLSEKYAAWADYNTPARGFGIHAYAHKVHRPIRLTDEELRAHPEWRNFGSDAGHHPPMRGWLVVPLIGSDGENYGFIQVSDRLDGDFTARDEANLVRLASLTATALDALAQLHLPEYRVKVADPGQ
jgi:GAF domain-containing protein